MSRTRHDLDAKLTKKWLSSNAVREGLLTSLILTLRETGDEDDVDTRVDRAAQEEFKRVQADEEYAPPERWLRQFEQRRLDPALRLGGEIHGIAGATLSAQAVTGAVRRALALFTVLIEDRGPER